MITSNLTGVVCGNSDVLLDQLIDEGVHFDLILTDPPYNINKDFGNKSDCLPLDEFIAITAERMAKIKKLLEPQGSVLWFGIHDYIGFVQVAMYNAGLHYRRMNIWHYENGFSRSKKEPATHYEPFLWFSNNPKKWRPRGTGTSCTCLRNDFRCIHIKRKSMKAVLQKNSLLVYRKPRHSGGVENSLSDEQNSLMC